MVPPVNNDFRIRLFESIAGAVKVKGCPSDYVAARPPHETVNLKTKVHLRDDGLRPWIELEPTDHPLAVEQRNGISTDRVAEIYSIMVHGADQ
jgi:hypothetical protein